MHHQERQWVRRAVVGAAHVVVVRCVGVSAGEGGDGSTGGTAEQTEGCSHGGAPRKVGHH
jgi:hypothetical protein